MSNSPNARAERAMSKEEMRVAIAEACDLGIFSNGTLRRQTRKGNEAQDGVVIAYKYCQGGGAYSWREIPDYLNDLNAIHEAEKVLTGAKQFRDYHEHLTEVTGAGLHSISHRATHALITATAAQRCEAFLRALGLYNPQPISP